MTKAPGCHLIFKKGERARVQVQGKPKLVVLMGKVVLLTPRLYFVKTEELRQVITEKQETFDEVAWKITRPGTWNSNNMWLASREAYRTTCERGREDNNGWTAVEDVESAEGQPLNGVQVQQCTSDNSTRQEYTTWAGRTVRPPKRFKDDVKF